MDQYNFTDEEWEAIREDYEDNAEQICESCNRYVCDWDVISVPVDSPDGLTPPDYRLYCPECEQEFKSRLETFEEFLERTENA